MLVFPSNRISGKLTLNGARGLSQRISRTDLTSLLSAYGVTTFVNRVRLAKQSSVTATSSSSSTTSMDICASFFWTIWSTPIQVRSSFLGFDNLGAPAVPEDLTTYLEYRRLTIDFIHARNQRIASWVAEHLCTSTTLGALGERHEVH